MRFGTLLFLCLTYSHIAQADTIHRCTDQSGNVSYSSTPCAAGTAQTKTLDPPPPPAANAGLDYEKEERAFQKK